MRYVPEDKSNKEGAGKIIVSQDDMARDRPGGRRS